VNTHNISFLQSEDEKKTSTLGYEDKHTQKVYMIYMISRPTFHHQETEQIANILAIGRYARRVGRMAARAALPLEIWPDT
jgi:hypothetical protein